MNETTDEILIRDLAVSCVIGVNSWERSSAQRLLISLVLHTHTAPAAQSDSLAHTVDYAAVCEMAGRIARQGRFRLIETLAEELAREILTLPGVTRVGVEIHKPGAVREAASVGVKIVRPAR
jgi:7,8-dihydroneopterin aldolase/epimerase/oxygenase